MNPQKQSAASTNNKKSLSQTGHFVYSSELPNPQNCKYISFYDTTAFGSLRLYRYHICRVIGMSAFCAEEPHHPSTCTGMRPLHAGWPSRQAPTAMMPMSSS